MKTISLRSVICLIMAVLAAGFIVEAAYASTHQGCSCCDSQCHHASKCHDTTKACLCNYLTLQVSLPRSNLVPGLIFTGYLRQKPHFTYLYLSSDDIFHPPKA